MADLDLPVAVQAQRPITGAPFGLGACGRHGDQHHRAVFALRDLAREHHARDRALRCRLGVHQHPGLAQVDSHRKAIGRQHPQVKAPVRVAGHFVRHAAARAGHAVAGQPDFEVRLQRVVGADTPGEDTGLAERQVQRCMGLAAVRVACGGDDVQPFAQVHQLCQRLFDHRAAIVRPGHGAVADVDDDLVVDVDAEVAIAPGAS